MNDKLKCYTNENYKKLLRNFHNNSYRHALIIEADIVHKDKCRLFHYSDLLRKAGNEFTALMKKRLDQLTRTKKYRSLVKKYQYYKDKDDKKNLAVIKKNLKHCRKNME